MTGCGLFLVMAVVLSSVSAFCHLKLLLATHRIQQAVLTFVLEKHPVISGQDDPTC